MAWLLSRALMDRYENSPCSPALAEESSAGCCSAGEPSAQSSSTPTPQAYLCGDRTTGAWSRFPSGMTYEPFEVSRGEALLTSYLAAFRAKTSRRPAKVRASTASVAASGPRWRESLAKYDPDSRSWKTRQCLLFEASTECLATFPRWGMTRGGELFRLPTPSGLAEIRAYITSAREFGLSLPTPRASDGEKGGPNQRGSKGDLMLSSAVTKLPTPCASDGNQGGTTQGNRKTPNLSIAVYQCATPTATDGRKWNAKTRAQRKSQGSSVRICNEDRGDGTPIGGQLNPSWVEWLMGWPLGWTDCERSAMDKFQSWRRLHGEFLAAMTGNEQAQAAGGER